MTRLDPEAFMTRVPIRFSLIAVLALASASCARTASTEVPEPAGETILVVENESTLQVTVYVLRDSQRRRLGTAAGVGETRLTIPANLIFGPTPLRFEIHPLASRATPISTQITVSPGEVIRLRVPSTIR
jgi:hypothetical protein